MLWLLFPLVAALGYALSQFVDNFLVDVYCRRLRPMCLAGVYAGLELVVCVAIFAWHGGGCLVVSDRGKSRYS